jgi:ubiquinone/menaquinone biosynthesis C-methylase UbiE
MSTQESADVAAAQPRERYVHGADPDEQRRLEQRTGATTAAFLLPYLHAGMQLLDCGCGPGTITLDLATAVAPGQVVGVDLQEQQVERARQLAAERGTANVRFEVADAYALPFPDESFDVAFAHALLNHLRDPLRALREMHRVLRPGGIVGIADSEFGSLVIYPTDPLIERALELWPRVLSHNRAAPRNLPRQYRRLLRSAGFVDVQATAMAGSHGTTAATRRRAEDTAMFLWQPGFAQVAIDQGWTDQPELEAIAAALLAWGEHPDAFWAALTIGAIGRKAATALAR